MSKRKFKCFLISDFEKEEKYLEEQHKKGWRLKKIKLPGFYYFEECQKADYTYKLELADVTLENRDNYIKMFEDCGWEYLYEFAGWYYFRKEKNEGNMEEDIFSDIESKIEHIQRIFTTRMIPIMVIFFLCVLPQAIQSISDLIAGGKLNVYTIVWLIILALYAFIFIKCGIGLNELKNKYSCKV